MPREAIDEVSFFRSGGGQAKTRFVDAPADDGEPLLPLAAASVRSIVIIGQDQFAAEACLGT